MASKQRRRGSEPERGPSPDPGPVVAAPLPDLPSFGPRAVERVSAQVARMLEEAQPKSLEEATALLDSVRGKPPVVPARTPLEAAQDLVYDAWEAPSRKQAVALARKALALSPDCADAYVLLAEETAASAQQACDLLVQAVAAGERSLGPDLFQGLIGMFWGDVRTRPYMRARAGLAESLWHVGKHEEALGHWRELLRLNPNDNQGIRYTLAGGLLQLRHDAELADLLKRYKSDISATWAYTGALVTFRREGASSRALRILDEALRRNPIVPEFFLGKRRLPRRLPDYVGFGDKDEAACYVAEYGDDWDQTPGAVDWLADHWNRIRPAAPGGKRAARGGK